MSEVVFREKSSAMDAEAKEDGFGSSPPVIHELKNYHPFASTRSFRLSRIRRDSFVAEHRSIGVFTSGGDASGNLPALPFLYGLIVKRHSSVYKNKTLILRITLMYLSRH